MLGKRKEPKAKKSGAEALLRDTQGAVAGKKPALFEKAQATLTSRDIVDRHIAEIGEIMLEV